MTLVADVFDHVVGVDTHARTHTYCVVHCRTGAVVATAVFPSSPAGCQRALAWIRRRASGAVLAAVEGTSSYGAGITTVLQYDGLEVAEVRPGPLPTPMPVSPTPLTPKRPLAQSSAATTPVSSGHGRPGSGPCFGSYSPRAP